LSAHHTGEKKHPEVALRTSFDRMPIGPPLHRMPEAPQRIFPMIPKVLSLLTMARSAAFHR